MTREKRTPAGSWIALATLLVTMWYAVVDKQVIVLLAQPLKADLHLSDTQIGSLQGIGAALFTAIAVFPIGWIADRVDRRFVLAACILVWSAAVAACGFAQGYWSLLACVAFLSAGETGLSPIVFALIPQLVAERVRMTVNFVMFGATLVGAGAGFALAGVVVDHIGWFAQWAPQGPFTRETWRLVFLVVAIPGPFLALAAACIRLQAREQVHDVPVAQPAARKREFLAYLASHWKAVAGIYVSSGLVTLGTAAIFTWLPVIFARQFGLNASAVGSGFGTAVAVGTIVGLGGAATSASFLKSKWGAATPVRLCLLGYCILALSAPLYLLFPTPSAMFVVAGIQMTALIGGNSLMPTLLQDLTPASLRGRIFATATVVTTVFQVISPIAVGLLSDHLFISAGGLLLSSIVLGISGFVLAAALLRLAEKHVVQTVYEVRALSSDAIS